MPVDFANQGWYNQRVDATCFSFPPVESADCRALVIGSMPGVASLRAGQYYAHPQNAFWPILYALWDAGAPSPCYEDRLAFALAHGVAIWDAAKTCTREGSGDADIQNAEPNDFAALFARRPLIRAVFTNGRTAHMLFLRHTAGGRPVTLLPSTSPAHTMPFQQKLAAWRALRDLLEGEP